MALPTSVPLSGSDDCKPQVGRQSVRQSVYTLEPFLECFQICPGHCVLACLVFQMLFLSQGIRMVRGGVDAISYGEWNYRDGYSTWRASQSFCPRHCFGSRLQHSKCEKARALCFLTCGEPLFCCVSEYTMTYPAILCSGRGHVCKVPWVRMEPLDTTLAQLPRSGMSGISAEFSIESHLLKLYILTECRLADGPGTDFRK